MQNCYLLDTHCLIWFQENNSRLPNHIIDVITSPYTTILFSQISLFEIVIKQKLNKLSFPKATLNDVVEQGTKDGFDFVPLNNSHLSRYNEIPLIEHHRDPFDRLLLATAMAEQATIISADKNFQLYTNLVKVLW